MLAASPVSAVLVSETSSAHMSLPGPKALRSHQGSQYLCSLARVSCFLLPLLQLQRGNTLFAVKGIRLDFWSGTWEYAESCWPALKRFLTGKKSTNCFCGLGWGGGCTIGRSSLVCWSQDPRARPPCCNQGPSVTRGGPEVWEMPDLVRRRHIYLKYLKSCRKSPIDFNSNVQLCLFLKFATFSWSPGWAESGVRCFPKSTAVCLLSLPKLWAAQMTCERGASSSGRPRRLIETPAPAITACPSHCGEAFILQACIRKNEPAGGPIIRKRPPTTTLEPRLSPDGALLFVCLLVSKEFVLLFCHSA